MSVNFIIEILIMKTKRGSSNGRSMCLLPTKREANSSESWWLTYKCLPDNSPPTTTNSNTQQTGYFHAWYISEYNILKSHLTPSLYAQDILSSIEGNSPFSKGFISVNIPISRYCARNMTSSSLDVWKYLQCELFGHTADIFLYETLAVDILWIWYHVYSLK